MSLGRVPPYMPPLTPRLRPMAVASENGSNRVSSSALPGRSSPGSVSYTHLTLPTILLV